MAFDKKLNMRLIKTSKKIYLIELLGGKCEHCGEDRFYVMNFHHDSKESEKEFNVASRCTNRLSDLIEESNKCIILCANCHQKHHMKINNEYEKRTNTKRTLFEYMGTSACKCCGESDSRILVFHHTRDKLFDISNWLTNKNITDVCKIPKEIKDELDKCVLLCHCCHLEEHYDHKFFKEYEEVIIKRSKSIKENSKPLDKEEVKRMYLSGMKQVEIAKHFGTVKSTVCDILKLFGLTNSRYHRKYDVQLILKLHGEGKCNKEILDIIKCDRSTLFDIFKQNGIKSNIPKRSKRYSKIE